MQIRIKFAFSYQILSQSHWNLIIIEFLKSKLYMSYESALKLL